VSIGKSELEHIKSLRTKKGRREQGRFLAEGVRLLEEAVRHRFPPQAVYFSEATLSDRGRRVVAGLGSIGALLSPVPARQLASMADTTTPQGLVAVFESPCDKFEELWCRSYRRLLWCESISDPGNLGTLVRSALAFEFDMAVVSGESAEVYSPKVVRASAGAVFGLPIARASVPEVLAVSRRIPLRIIAAAVSGETVPLRLTRKRDQGPLLLAIGSEAEGLPSEVTARADMRVRVPHSRRVDSLNAAVAGSILMNHLYRFSRN
jgi:TrmH family RNA methyltransferase